MINNINIYSKLLKFLCLRLRFLILKTNTNILKYNKENIYLFSKVYTLYCIYFYSICNNSN